MKSTFWLKPSNGKGITAKDKSFGKGKYLIELPIVVIVIIVIVETWWKNTD